MPLERSRMAKRGSSSFVSFWMTWRGGLCLNPIFCWPSFIRCIRLLFFPKDASNQGAFTNKHPCFLDLTIARLANLGAAHGCSLQTCSPKCTKDVQQGDYPEITMDGLNYAENVTYATWTSQSFGSDGETGIYLTWQNSPPLSVFLSPPLRKQKTQRFFFQVILWCNCWIRAWGEGLSSWFFGKIFVLHCSAWEHVSNGSSEFMSALKKKNS